MADKKSCFIIMPISTPEEFGTKYRDGADHFRHVLDCLFVPSVEAIGYRAIRPNAKGADLIHAEIVRNLEQSDVVLCDMSCLNPNVFFEYGIRTSLNKPVCVVKDELTKRVPFDAGILNYQEYRSSIDPWELPEEIKKLSEHIRVSEERSKGENTLWKYFGLRTEARSYVGETGAEAKIDYLTMQIDSLRQQVGNIVQRPENEETTERRDSVEDMSDWLLQQLPPGSEPTTFGLSPDGGCILTYRGQISDTQRHRLRRLAAIKFHQRLRLVREAQPEEASAQHPAVGDGKTAPQP